MKFLEALKMMIEDNSLVFIIKCEDDDENYLLLKIHNNKLCKQTPMLPFWDQYYISVEDQNEDWEIFKIPTSSDRAKKYAEMILDNERSKTCENEMIIEGIEYILEFINQNSQ